MADLEQLCAEFLQRYQTKTALLIGRQPSADYGLDFRYVTGGTYTAVVIGSLSAAELLYFSNSAVISALLEGKPVYLVQEGLEHRGHPNCPNRQLMARLLAAERQLKQLGIQFLCVKNQPRLITAELARQLRKNHQKPPENCRFTPLALEILEEKA